jgi:peptidyl-prolyl cis-trans isomerase C
MTTSPNLSRAAGVALLAATALTLASCSGNSSPGVSAKGDLFGNGQKDSSPVVARVGGVEITQGDLELRLKEMPDDLKAQYADPAEHRQLLRLMIGELLLAQGALASDATKHPDVVQQLITQRRTTLIDAYKEKVLWKDLEPTPEQIQQEYDLNKAIYYQVAATVQARHIQCNTKAEADAAWARLQAEGAARAFPYVVAELSRNPLSIKDEGLLGWFNRGGYIGALSYGKEFSEIVFDWDFGLHPPTKIGSHWHIVEILERQPARTLSLAEVKSRIVDQLMPGLQQAAKDEFLAARLKEEPVEFFGAYRPGGGRSAAELLKLAMLAAKFERKLELYDTLLEDYPESREAPMALFMKANLYLDATGDMYRCRRYLQQTIDLYPQSEVREQAQFMLDNLGKVDFKSPRSIQELSTQPR